MDLVTRQQELEARGLDRADLLDDPLAQFDQWFREVGELGLPEPEAMVLATADADGHPSARHVLLRGVDRGFVFFTNYTSAKADDLDANPAASLCFPWIRLSRQVRVSGPVTKVSEAESDEYFATRPRGSQIGAWASSQSTVIADRAELDRQVAAVEARFEGREVERPPQWGGYRLRPDELEFWQGRPNRLHDRFRYRRVAGGWAIERLSP